jgi:hypothetical protein
MFSAVMTVGAFCCCRAGSVVGPIQAYASSSEVVVVMIVVVTMRIIAAVVIMTLFFFFFLLLLKRNVFCWYGKSQTKYSGHYHLWL